MHLPLCPSPEQSPNQNELRTQEFLSRVGSLLAEGIRKWFCVHPQWRKPTLKWPEITRQSWDKGWDPQMREVKWNYVFISCLKIWKNDFFGEGWDTNWAPVIISKDDRISEQHCEEKRVLWTQRWVSDTGVCALCLSFLSCSMEIIIFSLLISPDYYET